MTSLNNILLAMSNVPVDDPIAEIWGRGLQGGYEIIEYTGALPITITADGSALLDYKIYGNTVQDGTPTPEAPVDVVGCGTRTENIIDVYSTFGNKVVISGGLKFNLSEIPQCITVNGQSNGVYPQIQIWGENGVLQLENGKTYTASIRTTNAPEESDVYMIVAGCDAENNWTNITYIYSNKDAASFSVLEDYVNYRYIIVCQNLGITYDDMKIYLMIAEGSTPPETYEPYGYKLPMVSRTENLFDKNATDTSKGYIKNYMLQKDGTTLSWIVFSTSEYMEVSPNTAYYLSNVMNAAFNAPSLCFYDDNKDYISGVQYQLRYSFSFTTPNNAKYVRISYTNDIVDITMLSVGSTPLPYEPYNSTTTNIYLGEAETTRRIKKLVLTGKETWNFQSINSYGIANLYTIFSERYGDSLVGLSSHFNIQTTLIGDTTTEGFYLSSGEVLYIRIDATKASTPSDLKSYLAAQYAAGTPVTVWYVLANPTTGIVNEPLMKIGEYADTVSMEQADVNIPTIAGTTVIDYDGELKPSQMSIKYKTRR